jgi:hypothetical protein
LVLLQLLVDIRDSDVTHFVLQRRFTPVKMQKVHARTPKDDPHDPEHSETALQLKAKVADLKSSVSSEAQRIIHEVMPKKVGDLSNRFRRTNSRKLISNPQIAELSRMLSDSEIFQYPQVDEACQVLP